MPHDLLVNENSAGEWFNIEGTGACILASARNSTLPGGTVLAVYEGDCDNLSCVQASRTPQVAYGTATDVSFFGELNKKYRIFIGGVTFPVGSQAAHEGGSVGLEIMVSEVSSFLDPDLEFISLLHPNSPQSCSGVIRLQTRMSVVFSIMVWFVPILFLRNTTIVSFLPTSKDPFHSRR